MFEPRFFAGATEKYRCGKTSHVKTVAGSYDVEGHAQKCVERHCKLPNKKMVQLYKVSSPCLDDHHFKKEELESVGELSKVCSQIVLGWLNKLARSVTKWTGACDRRLARLISYIHHTKNYRQYCHVENTAQHRRLGQFQDSDIAGDVEEEESTSGGVLCIFRSRTLVPRLLDVQETNEVQSTTAKHPIRHVHTQKQYDHTISPYHRMLPRVVRRI